jgi:hypothetical protein
MVSVKAGLEKWGIKAKCALIDELNLFIDQKVFEQIINPTEEQKRRALRIHCFMTEKRDGRIKARAVADGRSQTRYLEEQTYSPTVKLESIMLCSMIDAFEGRFVTTVDIKGAFLKAEVPEGLELLVKMDGELASNFCELNHDFKIGQEGTLYLKCLKALYGHIEAARLFYDNLDSSLTARMGFKRNQYDPCVYNRESSTGEITTIKTHVDDLKISSKSKFQVDHVVTELREIYQEITVNEGDEHDYLGMTMVFDRDKNQVKINMEKYIKEVFRSFEEMEPDEKIKGVSTPATNNLFKTREGDVEKISKQRASNFHATVAKLLFVAKRARPDILLAVSFLTTRVKSPDSDDWSKMKRILGYLLETMEYYFTLNCSNLSNLTWYIDGSYASHSDMKGQSGAVLVAGDCAVLFKSNKQKVNTRSSTETELIAVDDALPTVQWVRSFMLEQGYDLDTMIKEDNRSTMLLMKNGRLSSGKRTKHFDIRYFYVKDLLDRKIINLSHCVSEEMIADFFTKPVQGKRFREIRDVILNVNPPDEHRSVLVNSTKDIVQLKDLDLREKE